MPNETALPSSLTIAGEQYVRLDVMRAAIEQVAEKWQAKAGEIAAAALREVDAALADRVLLEVEDWEAELHGRTVEAVRELLAGCERNLSDFRPARPIVKPPVAEADAPSFRIYKGEAFAIDPTKPGSEVAVASMKANAEGWPTICLYSTQGLPLVAASLMTLDDNGSPAECWVVSEMHMDMKPGDQLPTWSVTRNTIIERNRVNYGR